MRISKEELPIYTLDLETDPFKHGRLPQPFVAGVYSERDGFKSFWRKNRSSVDIILQCVAYLDSLPRGLIFIHNGGRFDLFYFLTHLDKGEMFILNNRIVSARLGKHEVRDSFAIMPFALRNYKKDEIDYSKMELENREANKQEILEYLFGDCKYLHELCSAFVKRFGPKLTIGSTSLGELKKRYDYTTLNEEEDNEIRSKYYYGGRVQCFEKGIVESDIKVYDVNSMYPFCMKKFKHPVGRPIGYGTKINRHTFFVTVTGRNLGAFPTKQGIKTSYDVPQGTFTISIHEYRVAVALGLFVPQRIEQTIDFGDSTNFGNFVTEFYSEREHAKITGDTITNLFTKFVLNSAYGKFAQNPENCFDYCITDADKILDGWNPAWIAESKYIIWKKPSDIANRLRVNVATAASITGAARSVLLKAIAKSKRPLYCDTDSLICESLKGVKINESELGAWKLEKSGSRIAVAGRKMYAVFGKKNECVKMASKGVKLSAEEIERVARGETVNYKHMVPSFSWDGSHRFITRNVRLT